MSHMSNSESYKSHCLGLLSKYQEKERKKKEELASTRPVGFAAGKNIHFFLKIGHFQSLKLADFFQVVVKYAQCSPFL